MTTSSPAVLRNRVAAVCALVFCIYAALPQSITSLRSISALIPLERDPIMIFGLIASVVITGSIASRSSFVGDRVVFGVGAAAFLLWLITALVLPGASATSVINGFVSLLWTIGAIASSVILVRIFRRRAGD